MDRIIELNTPLTESAISDLSVGDVISISGYIYCGRDAVLPRICKEIKDGTWAKRGIDLSGAVIFHTAVSPAGVGPTSSNKLEIESSFPILSAAGVMIHLGTIANLQENSAVFAVIPPVTSLLESQTFERECVAFPELGMEAFYRIKVVNYQAVIAAAQGKSIYG